MSFKPTKIASVTKAYKFTVQASKNQPIVLAPFVIFCCIELITLFFVYSAPRQPLIAVLGPPIRAFWGERFLHYPANFILLPKLAALSRMALSVFFGSLLTGMAVALVADGYNKRQGKLGEALKIGIKRYIPLFVIVYIFSFLFYIIAKVTTKLLIAYFMAGHVKLLFLGAGVWMGPMMILFNLILAVLLQGTFVYAIPLLIIDRLSLIKSIGRGFVYFKRLFLPTIILAGLPMLIYIPISILHYKTAFLIDRIFPESVLIVSVAGTLISSLVVDALITVSTTALFLQSREKA